MRLPPLSLLAFPISPPHHLHQRHCPTALFIQQPKKQLDEAIVAEVSANAIKLEHTQADDARKKKRSNRKRSPKYNQFTTRQKSISLGNDPIKSLNLNLDHLAKSTQNPASAIRAEEMLLRIEALHADGYYEKPPDVVSYNCVINAYAHGRGGDLDRLKNGERLLTRMKGRGIEPNEITYNTLLRCLLKEIEEMNGNTALRKEKVQKAESILSTMEQLGISNTISYNTMISIMSKSQLEVAPQKAEYWLRHMMKQYNSSGNDERLEPDVCSFNSVIHAFASAIDSKRQHDKNNSLYASRAEELLNEMLSLYNSGSITNVQPDVVSYSTVINAHARAVSKENEWCAERALAILKMIEQNAAKNEKSVKPNKTTYSAVINSFARVGNAKAADDLLWKMKEISSKSEDGQLKPDAVCYTSVIDSYAKQGGEDAADRAEELLREMEDLYNNGDLNVKPNVKTYCAVINALGKSGKPRNAEKAEQMLDEMEHMSSTYGFRDLAPNTICYNSVITAYARSTSVSKAYRAELLLERMIEGSKNGNSRIRPNTITFNSVINAAAQSFYGDDIVKKEAYLIALNAFKTLHGLDYCKPTSITYTSFLKVLQNLIFDADARDYMAKKVFLLSAKMGLDDDSVRLQLTRSCSTPLVAQQLIDSVGIKNNDAK